MDLALLLRLSLRSRPSVDWSLFHSLSFPSRQLVDRSLLLSLSLSSEKFVDQSLLHSPLVVFIYFNFVGLGVYSQRGCEGRAPKVNKYSEVVIGDLQESPLGEF